MSTLQLLPIVKIRTERNVRDKVDDLGELTASIKAVGVLEPITVRPDGGDYVVMWGHRRLAAALIAGLTEIPAIVRVDLDVVNQASAQLIENLMRKDIAPLEEAGGYKRLIDLGLSQGGVAAKVGCSQGHVSKRLALLALPKKVREQVNSGGITIEAALEPKREKRAPKAKAPRVTPGAEFLEPEPWSMPGAKHVAEVVSRKVDEVTTAMVQPDACPTCGRPFAAPADYLAPMPFEIVDVAPVWTAPVGEPVSQHVCRSCGGREGPWAEMVEVGWLCVNCDAAAPVVAKAETARAVDQRARV